MMTPEERTREEAWHRRQEARRQAAITAGHDWDEPEDGVFCNSMYYVEKMFPIPNTDGMSPAEAEATLARWRAAVHKYVDDREAASRAAHAPKPAGAAAS